MKENYTMNTNYKSKKDEIKDYIILEILKGHFKPGDKLNDIKFYINKFKVNPNLAREALNDLINDGIIIKEPEDYIIIIDQLRIDGLKNRYLNIYINELVEKANSLGYSLDDVIDSLNLRNVANG